MPLSLIRRIILAEAIQLQARGPAAETAMIKLSRMADYGVVLMTELACATDTLRTASELAANTALPVPTVSKVLKLLAHAGLLESRRGIKGGYALARDASAITMVDIIDAMEGPIALTDCIGPGGTLCEIEALCPTRTNWHRINDVLTQVLRNVTLAEMTMSPLEFNALLRRTADAAAPAAWD